MLTIFSF